MTPSPRTKDPILRTSGLGVTYADGGPALRDISLSVPERQIVSIIGPSGCGKSTLLRCFNRMHDFAPGVEVTGTVHFRQTDIYAPGTDVAEVRRAIGMVFQQPNPFPRSISDNLSFGLRINGYQDDIADRVEHALRAVGLWDEVSDRLDTPAPHLSLGQQQRLCVARALAIEPEVLLMDEPASALDPQASAHLEELIRELRTDYTILLVTHSRQRASRVSDYSAFLYSGELVEYGETDRFFTNPQDERTEAYITGRLG